MRMAPTCTVTARRHEFGPVVSCGFFLKRSKPQHEFFVTRVTADQFCCSAEPIFALHLWFARFDAAENTKP
jgi:hypothetical protein